MDFQARKPPQAARDTSGDTLLAIVMGVCLLWAIGIGYQFHRTATALWVGLPLCAIAWLLWAVARGTFFCRAGMAVLSMTMVALQIEVGMGQNLYHFGVFVVLAILLIYRDWRVPVIAAVLIALQHVAFNVMQEAGWSVICFAKPSWSEVVAHAAYVVAQTAIEVWIALRLAADERGALEISGLVVARDGRINLDQRRATATSELAQPVAAALELMRDAVVQVKASTSQIRRASRDLSQGSEDLTERTAEQAAGLEQSSRAMEQFTVGLNQNSQDARHASELAANASEVATRGGAVVRDVVTTMNAISDDSRKISEIIGIIDGIAFQTNILALNAAVEAARAGEQGRGFAVVASEVRSLAQRSAAAARETKQLIESSSARVSAGTKLVDNAGRTMDEMVAAVQQVAAIIGNIAQVSAQQMSSVREVERSIDSIEETTRRNAERVRQSSEAARDVTAQAEALAAAVSRFRLAGAGADDLEAEHASATAIGFSRRNTLLPSLG
jgi:methyl-accepting chemotaxis protein